MHLYQGLVEKACAHGLRAWSTLQRRQDALSVVVGDVHLCTVQCSAVQRYSRYATPRRRRGTKRSECRTVREKKIVNQKCDISSVCVCGCGLTVCLYCTAAAPEKHIFVTVFLLACDNDPRRVWQVCNSHVVI